MAISEVKICNIALSRVGDALITALTENSKQGRTCNLLYEANRDDLLYSHPWNFAMDRATLARLSEVPAFEFRYQYQLPSDCLRAWKIYNSSSKWIREANKLLIDDDAVYLKYIAKITDVNQFNARFVNCLALKLASELAVRLADSKTLKNLVLKEYLVMLREAYALNAIEGDPPEDLEDTEWQKAGR